MTRAMIYTRVSSDPKQRGRSVEEQEAECRAVCKGQGWDVVGVVVDNDRSASRHAKRRREGWDDVLAGIRAGTFDVLVTWEASRAGRDLKAYTDLRSLCAQHRVLWHYGGTTYDLDNADDRFRTGLDNLLAENEAEKTRARVKRAMRANADKGRPHGRLPYGYMRVYDERTGDLLTQVPDPAQAAIIVEVARRFLAGEAVGRIAADLNRRNVPKPTGAPWNPSSLKRMLLNPTAIGLRTHQGQVMREATWEPILDRETYDAIVAKFDQPQYTRSRNIEGAYLLSGAGRCGKCGGRISHIRQQLRGNRSVYYCRSNSHVVRDREKLDAYVTAVVLERLRQPDAADVVRSGPPSEEVVTARRKVAQLRKRLDDATAEYVAGRLTAATLARVEKSLLADIAQAERQTRVASVPTVAKQLLEHDDVSAAWDAMTQRQRRQIITALLVVHIDPIDRRSNTFDPSRIRIEWLH